MKDRSAIIARSQLCRNNVGEVARPSPCLLFSRADGLGEAFRRPLWAAQTVKFSARTLSYRTL
eukprot:4959234-Prymnesium_polylepis.1